MCVIYLDRFAQALLHKLVTEAVERLPNSG
jgi:hypothetical protein